MSTHELHDEVENMLGRLDLVMFIVVILQSYLVECANEWLWARSNYKAANCAFDEPTTGLDPERKFGVFEMIAYYRKQFGFTALLVSHDIPEVFQISDRVAWLDQGKLRFVGKPEELELSADVNYLDF